MTTPTPSEIKQYWNNKAIQLGVDPSATMKDVILRSLEIEAISTRLRSDDSLLDIGCGNAFGSLTFAKHAASVVAADYSEKMVESAQAAIEASGQKNIQAKQADVTEAGSQFRAMFTAASCVRCLINLPEEDQQYQALDQLTQVLKPGGRLFLIEGVAEHFAAMNKMREASGLPAIVLDWHNRLFAKAKLEQALSGSCTIEERVDFGEYYFMSRILHPLAVAPEEPTFTRRINQAAKSIWQSHAASGRFADISTLMLYVCRKR